MSGNRNLAVAMRPETFEGCIGNNKILEDIRSRLASNRVPTAFLLAGPTGCGKTTIARCINKRLNGELVEINAADDTGVDAARVLGERAAFKPGFGYDYLTLLLDEAHQLTKQAQNALLKHVEDAPTSTTWIFSTTEPGKIIPTLRGRCISFTLASLTPEQIALLVYRGLSFLGKKGLNGIEDFIKVLVRENISTPRAILMATERWAGGMDALGAIFGAQDASEAFEIARATFKQDWKTVREKLAASSAEEAMTIRMVCANYFKAALLKDSSSTFCSEAIFELTKTIPFDGPLAMAELSARLYNISVRFDRPRS